MGVFGSYIEADRADYGDIDVVLDQRILRQYCFENYRASIARLWQVDHPDWQRDEEFMFWLKDPERRRPPDRVAYYPERKVKKHLKKGDRYLSFHDVEERLDTPVLVLYTKEEGVLAVPRRQAWPKLPVCEEQLGAERRGRPQ